MEKRAYKYFVGLNFSDFFSRKISELQNSFYDERFMLRPLVPHVTLLPPPALATINPIDFSEIIKKMADDFLPLNISLETVETFGTRVVYINIKGPSLSALQEHLVGLLPPGNQNKLRDEFTAHLTLAQAKQYKTLPTELIEEYKTAAAKLLPQYFKIQHLTIFEWQAPRTYKISKI